MSRVSWLPSSRSRIRQNAGCWPCILANAATVWLLALLVLWTPALDAQDKKKKPEAPPPPLQARCDRDDAIYKVGEKATFFIRSENDGEASWQLSNDGYSIIETGKI